VLAQLGVETGVSRSRSSYLQGRGQRVDWEFGAGCCFTWRLDVDESSLLIVCFGRHEAVESLRQREVEAIILPGKESAISIIMAVDVGFVFGFGLSFHMATRC